MAAKKKAAKAGAGAVAAGQAARDNPYVQRLVEDADLRDDLRTAFESARKAYGRMNGKGPQKALEDKKMQKELKEAATRSRARPTPCARRPSARSAAGGCCSSASSAPGWRSPSARACARRCSTRCSVPRRSSSTPRPPPRAPSSGTTQRSEPSAPSRSRYSRRLVGGALGAPPSFRAVS